MSNTSDLGQTAKRHASELGAQAKAAAAQEAVARAEMAKGAAASKLQQAAEATDAFAHERDPASPQAQAVQQVAEHIESLATNLRTADIGQLADQATDMARRNPLLFIGGAAIAGFAAARFLKARHPLPAKQVNQDDPWGSPEAAKGDAEQHMAEIDGGPTHG